MFLMTVLQTLVYFAIYFIRANQDILAAWAITAAIGVSFGWYEHVKKNYK